MYVAVYLLLVPTGLAQFVVSTCPSLLLNLLLVSMDGLLRGTTACGMAALAASKGMGPWAGALLAALGTCAGGWAVQLLGADNGVPRAPAMLAGGLWATLEVWGAMAASAVYVALTQRGGAQLKAADSSNARGVVVVLFVGLFAARVVALAASRFTQKQSEPVSQNKTAPKVAEKKLASPVQAVEEVEVLKVPTHVASSGAKKRKNKKKAAARST